MPTLHVAILALIQGITEFLPISSSGHLALTPIIIGWRDQGLLLDVAVHVGTLGAVIIYFWRDVWAMVIGCVRLFTGRRDEGTRLAGLVIVATIPLIGAGYAVNAYAGDSLRSLMVIGWATLGFGIVLYICDQVGMTVKRLDHIGFGGALLIGLAQCLALIPGASRAGVTMSAGRILGLERQDCARFSMLLSIPAILGAGTLKGYELYQTDDVALTLAALTGAGIAFIAALVTIWALMAWVRRFSLTPFVMYRIILGIVLLLMAYNVI